MTTPTFKRLGPLYKAVGLTTSPELVGTRLSAAQKAYKSLDAQSIVPLTRAALRISKPDELDFLLSLLGKDDPTFDVRGDDVEIAIIAAAALFEMIESKGPLSLPAGLAVVAAGFGGVRPFVDTDLAPLAADSLTELQRGGRSKPTAATYRSKPALKEDLDGIEEQVEESNFAESVPHIKKLFETSVNYTQAGLQDLANQLQRVIQHQSRLEEEMNIHWWLVGGWSRDADKAFSDLKMERASLLAGKELADLTVTNAGVASAPALLSMVLEKGRRGAAKAVSLASQIPHTPIDERRRWSQALDGKSALATLVPLNLAAALAAESDDADDWKPRFQRLTGIDPSVALAPLDSSLQFYREMLLIRELA